MEIKQKQRILLGFGFILGIFLFSLQSYVGINAENETVFQWRNILEIAFREIDYSAYFLYLLRKRGGILCLLFLLSLTNARELFFHFYIFVVGISAGYLCRAVINLYAAKGILVVISLLFPQMLFYAPAFLQWICFLESFQNAKKRIEEKKQRTGKFGKISKITRIVLLTIIGIFSECYVNPIIIKIFVKNL